MRVGPKRRDRVERKDDILANHGVHIAGTDFAHRIELKQILPTWHLINTTYGPARLLELAQMKTFYADSRHHQRLLRVLTERLDRLGHSCTAGFCLKRAG